MSDPTHPLAEFLGRDIGLPDGTVATITDVHADGTATLRRDGMCVAVVHANGVLTGVRGSSSYTPEPDDVIVDSATGHGYVIDHIEASTGAVLVTALNGGERTFFAADEAGLIDRAPIDAIAERRAAAELAIEMHAAGATNVSDYHDHVDANEAIDEHATAAGVALRDLGALNRIAALADEIVAKMPARETS